MENMALACTPPPPEERIKDIIVGLIVDIEIQTVP